MTVTSRPHELLRVLTPDGVSISVGEWGNPDGPEILFIPGLAQSTLSFREGRNTQNNAKIGAQNTEIHARDNCMVESPTETRRIKAEAPIPIGALK